MEIKMKDFRGFKAKYHRNGISGEGFYACSFLFRDGQGQELTPMVAIVWAGEQPIESRVAVISVPDGEPNIKARWRGDEFAEALRASIAAVEKAQPESLYS